MTETRSLKMHQELLMKVIRDQACTLEKAILEGVMNAVESYDDPNKAKVNIEAWTRDKKAFIRISDEGCGIATEDELIHHFETFGTPHDESEHGVWKRFRMGRGQMFAYGKNTWRTASFKMVVDIKNEGLTYHLERNLPMVKGTVIDIELYDNPFGLIYPTIDSLKDKIAQQVEFMPGVITFNDKRINTPADEIPPEKWTVITEDAYILLGVGNKLTWYNLGAYVMDTPASEIGVVGVVVSRKRFDVNFARGGIHLRCPVYQRILTELAKHKPANKVKRRRRRVLQEYEKINLLQDLRDGIVSYKDVSAISLIPTTSGRSYSLNKIKNISSPWTFGQEGDRMADKLMQSGCMIVFDSRVMEALRYNGKEKDFFAWLVARQPIETHRSFQKVAKWYNAFEEVTSGFSEIYNILPQEKLTKPEKRLLKALERRCDWQGRRLCIGVSDVAQAWTDGSTYIALDRSWVKSLSLNSPWGASQLLAVLVHELAHDENTAGSHIHGEAFYRHFHDIVLDKYRSPLHLVGELREELKAVERLMRAEKAAAKERKAKEQVGKALGVEKVAAKGN